MIRKPYVYAISDGVHIKIGVAQCPHNRLKQLATGNPNKLTILGTFDGGYELESELHKRFTKVRDNGEWFIPTESLLEYLNTNIQDKHITLINNQIKFYPKVPL